MSLCFICFTLRAILAMALVPWDENDAGTLGNLFEEGEDMIGDQPVALGDDDDVHEAANDRPAVDLAVALPYEVATITGGLNQRAYWDKKTGGEPEWLWGRVHMFCTIGTHAYKLLGQGRGSILQNFSTFEVPEAELHYRTKQEQQDRATHGMWKEHTIESRGLLVTLMWLMKNRALGLTCKKKALGLLTGLVQACLAFNCSGGAAQAQVSCAVPHEHQDQLVQHVISFTAQGITHDWGAVLEQFSPALKLWKKLQKAKWLEHCIASSEGATTIADILLFLCYIHAHPSLKIGGRLMFPVFGKIVGQGFVFHLGTWLAEFAKHLTGQALEPLPMIKNKQGTFTKALDPVNRVLLLLKLRKEKVHRQRVAKTHGELAFGDNRMMRYEAWVDCILYMQKIHHTFHSQQIKQVSIHWDPSSYGGREVMVGVAYSHELDVACYMMNQHLTKLMVSDLEESLLPLAHKKKLTRLSGYNELRGVSHALESIGLSLLDFKVPQGLIARPLVGQELMVRGPDGRPWVVHAKHGFTPIPMVADSVDLQQLPLLCSVSDQGPSNVPALNYLMYSQSALLLFAQYDIFHRCWNDVKAAGKKSLCGGWSCILQLTLLYNVNFGPFGSGQWMHRKRTCLEEFLQLHTIDSDVFQKYKAFIAMERRVPEPDSIEDQQALFESLGRLQNFNLKGPLVKLARWFSWWESSTHWQGECWASKMILEAMGETIGGEEEEIEFKDQKTAQDELRELKKKKGTWKLQGKMVSPKNMATKGILMTVVKAAWKYHADRARSVKSAKDVLAFNIGAAGSMLWAAELEETVNNSLWRSTELSHLFEDFCVHPSALLWHCDFFDKFLEARAMSLVSFHTLPPNKYHHALSRDRQMSISAHKAAVKDFKALLGAEAADAGGAPVHALAYMHWRPNPVARSILLAYDQDEHLHRYGTQLAAGPSLQRVLAQTLGDTKMVENSHQFGKDLLRSSRCKTFGDVRIMSNTLKSKALEERGTPVVQVPTAEKVMAPHYSQVDGKKNAVTKSLRAKGYHLPKSIQNMMMPIRKGNMWPSPSPQAAFQSVAATEWVHRFFQSNDFDNCKANDSWYSVMAQPGHVVAHSQTSSLWKVVASAEYGFLGWLISIHKTGDGQSYFLLEPHRNQLVWQHVVALEEWLDVPVEPCLLVQDRGPIGWQPTSDPLPLDVALVAQGIPLTAKQMRVLLRDCYNIKMPATASKAALEGQLIQAVLPEGLQATAKRNYEEKAKKKKEEDLDSDMSEVISELAQDEHNLQDLKEYQVKKKKQRLKRKMAAKPKDTPVETKAKKKRKSTGKAKGTKRKATSFIEGFLGKRKKAQQPAEQQEVNPSSSSKPHVDAEPVPPAPETTPVDAEQVPPESETVDKSPATVDTPPATTDKSPATIDKSPATIDNRPAEGQPAVDYDRVCSKASKPKTTASSSAEPKAAAAPRQPRQRSPEEVLSLMAPPTCTFGISFTDHRFTSSMRAESKEFTGRMKQSTMTCSFAHRTSWQDAIKSVHQFNWRKWHMVKKKYPLARGAQEQVPGEIAQDLMDQLKVHIDALPPIAKKWLTQLQSSIVIAQKAAALWLCVYWFVLVVINFKSCCGTDLLQPRKGQVITWCHVGYEWPGSGTAA